MSKFKNNIKNGSYPLLMVAITGILTFSFISSATSVSAAETENHPNNRVEFKKPNETNERGGMRATGIGEMKKGIFGEVVSINGNTIVMNSKIASSTKSYTVNANNATIYKNNATTSIANILTGDKIMVSGDISGTNITAKIIRDGEIKDDMRNSSSTPDKDWHNFASSTASTTQPNGFLHKIKNFFSKIFHW